jgi:peptidoglycan hydrolase-like protein with peptidoglycan-binding domain
VQRDLADPQLWARSLERSRRRRALAAQANKTRVTRAQVSAALITTTVVAPVAPAAAQTLRRGSEGADVVAIQKALGISADGVFGPQTRRAVRDFQARNGLVVDGIVGPVTSRALGLGGASVRSAGGSGVAALQAKLGVAADGEYGPITRQAVRDFQARHGLTVDGVAGPVTLGALGLSGPTLGAGGGSSGGGGGGGGGSAVAAAQSKLGAPYEFGGEGPAWDCSGLTQWAMAQRGISLPRTSYSQFGVGMAVDRASIQAGDLVFFDTDGTGASHVGIATSNSSVISATTRGVREHGISGEYWGERYVGARRL